tara:strand:+ start:2733 stop:2918 length:186 start_codon:yes stop_codon:yes gene_type:complete
MAVSNLRLTRSKTRQPQTNSENQPVVASITALCITEESGDNEAAENMHIERPLSHKKPQDR